MFLSWNGGDRILDDSGRLTKRRGLQLVDRLVFKTYRETMGLAAVYLLGRSEVMLTGVAVLRTTPFHDFQALGCLCSASFW
jgi:hypothetical protein